MADRDTDTSTDPVEVTRTIDPDLTADELWALIADRAGWDRWLVDEADLTVEPGGGGRVVDRGEERQVRIEEVADGARLRYSWWPTARPDLASTVTFTVGEDEGRPVLHVVERFPAPAFRTDSAATATLAWSVRSLCAWSIGTARARR